MFGEMCLELFSATSIYFFVNRAFIKIIFNLAFDIDEKKISDNLKLVDLSKVNFHVQSELFEKALADFMISNKLLRHPKISA